MVLGGFTLPIDEQINSVEVQSEATQGFIKWIDFNVKKDILARTQVAHKTLIKQGIEDIGTCELLAYLAMQNGNHFSNKTDTSRLNKLMVQLKKGDRSSIDKFVDNKYYKYYTQGYHAVLDGIIDAKTGETIGYFPLAKGYWYNHYDDFGASRGYGYKRRHLGNDLFGSVGTPIIAVEGGTVTELGWNQYGGWRIGIRSDCTKRYYYYAHLRKGKPFPAGLKPGDRVEAGDVIGFMGATGYSRKEDTNMTSAKPHLHFGMQIIFDKSQEDGPTELWIDVYELGKFLTRNRARTVKNPQTGEHESVTSKKHVFIR